MIASLDRAGLLGLHPVERAIQIAIVAHAGQRDKAGAPYILHCLRVMLSVHGEEAQVAAVLHDSVEDSALTVDDLADLGFTSAVLEAVEALTKRPGESRVDAAHRAAANPIARVVKLADNADNSDLRRIGNPTAKDFARLEEYKMVRAILLAAGEAGSGG